MIDLDAFLEKNVEGYLFGDLATLKIATHQPERTYGAVAYPLLLSTFAGIELLGALVSSRAFVPNNGSKYFDSFWRNYLYNTDAARADAGASIYKLARHGLAHSFVVKGTLEVVKHAPHLHLVRMNNGAFSVDAVQLATDLETAYQTRVKVLARAVSGTVTTHTMSDRLNEMATEFQQQASPIMNSLRLPEAIPNSTGPMTTDLPSNTDGTQGPSGSAFPMPSTVERGIGAYRDKLTNI